MQKLVLYQRSATITTVNLDGYHLYTWTLPVSGKIIMAGATHRNYSSWTGLDVSWDDTHAYFNAGMDGSREVYFSGSWVGTIAYFAN